MFANFRANSLVYILVLARRKGKDTMYYNAGDEATSQIASTVCDTLPVHLQIQLHAC